MVGNGITEKVELGINRLVLGVIFLILFGVVGGIVVLLFSIPLTGDIADLGTGFAVLGEDPLTGFGLIIFWALSTLIIAGIAILIAGKKRLLVPFKRVEKEADIPKGVTVVTAIVLGGIISFLLFLANRLLNIFGSDLSAGDITILGTALLEGDFTTLFLGLIFAVIVGTIVIFVADRTRDVQGLAQKAGIDKF
jgi:hypothetical protein